MAYLLEEHLAVGATKARREGLEADGGEVQRAGDELELGAHLVDGAAEREQAERRPLLEAQPLVEEELVQQAAPDDANVDQHAVRHGVEEHQVQEEERVVHGVHERRYRKVHAHAELAQDVRRLTAPLCDGDAVDRASTTPNREPHGTRVSVLACLLAL